jgi:hypothetical protein
MAFRASEGETEIRSVAHATAKRTGLPVHIFKLRGAGRPPQCIEQIIPDNYTAAASTTAARKAL